MSAAPSPFGTALRLATAPVTWGVEPGSPDNPPWPLVLDEIAQSDVDALELGPIGYLPQEPEALRAALSTRGLTAVGSYVLEDMHDPAAAESVLASAERACRVTAAAGGSVVVIIDRPSAERGATAGRPAAARRLAGDPWRAMLDVMRQVAAIAADWGLRAAVHPHAGSFVEFDDEVDRLLRDSDLDLCLDTGHLAYAGSSPADAIVRYGDRLAHVHLKDVDPVVLERVVRQRVGFTDAVARGIFCPLGRGMVDLGGVLRALRRVGYEGFATIEQDRAAGAGAPASELAESLDALARAAATQITRTVRTTQ